MSDNIPLLDANELSQYFDKLSDGKVRSNFKIDEQTLLFVATDRVSAFDVVLSNGVPSKGELLTAMSEYWFTFLRSAIPDLKTHFLSTQLPEPLASSPLSVRYKRRCMQVRKLKVLPIESIVRGYLAGSAWNEYKQNGTVHGLSMPEGLEENEKLAEPIWTPSTKAEQGEHDENISPDRAVELLGREVAERVKQLSLQIYKVARDHVASKIIIADTKLEFALDNEDNSVCLVDEVLTPDSSRFWPLESYAPGKTPKSMDKQPLRDWLRREKLKGEPNTSMPPDVVEQTFGGYKKAYERVTGCTWTN